MLKIKKILWLLAGFLVLNSASTMAVTVYDESLSGDLDSDWTQNVINLNFGVNSVLGNVTWASGADNYDQFTFVIPTGAELSSVTYSFFNVNYGDISNVRESFLIRDANTYFDLTNRDEFNIVTSSYDSSIQNYALAPSPVSLFDTYLPIDSGEYLWLLGGGGYSSWRDASPFINWDYKIDFELSRVGGVSSVPVPAAVWLFGSAIAGFAGFSRFKKKAAK